MKNKILIIGSGAFGTALSQPLIDNHHDVYFYCKNKDNAIDLMKGKHPIFKDIALSSPKQCFTSLSEAFKKEKYDYILLAVPSKSLEDIYNDLKPYLNKDIKIINTSKGLANTEDGTWSSLFLKDNLINSYALIVGPSFADELVQRMKTIINVVSPRDDLNKEVGKLFNNDYFKLIPFKDEFIASLASSFKNSLALALGLLSYYTDSQNTKSAYLTIGISEIQKIIAAINPQETNNLLNFYGIGDIFLTCNSEMSRNYSFGKLIGQVGFKEANIINNGKTVEGIRTLGFVNKIKKIYHLDLPLFDSLYKICFENKDHASFLEDVWQSFKSI